MMVNFHRLQQPFFLLFLFFIFPIKLLFMNYNDFTYYRANPYANQGYIPPIAHLNRHKPDFFTQLPQGEEHYSSKTGKRQYGLIAQRSSIEQEGILKSPQRFPFENRIAFDKKYERNMNTIDIEGATSGTLKSPGVVNKLKARQHLVRKQKQTSQTNFEQLQRLESTEQQKRRHIAYEQYLRNQKIQLLNSGKLLNKYNQQEMPEFNNKNEKSIQQSNYHLGDNMYNPERKNQSLDKRRYQNEYRDIQPERFQSIELNRPRDLQQHAMDNIPSHRTINQNDSLKNHTSSSQYHSHSNKNENEFGNEKLLRESQLLKSYYENLQQNQNQGKSLNKQRESSLNVDRKQLRQQNPTVLSSENSIYLAGKNLISK